MDSTDSENHSRQDRPQYFPLRYLPKAQVPLPPSLLPSSSLTLLSSYFSPLLFTEAHAAHDSLDGLVNSTGPSTARLKRANVLRISSQKGGMLCSATSPEASIYSTYLVLFSRVVSSGLRAPTTKRAPPTLSEVITRLNLNHSSLPSSPLVSSLSPSQEEEVPPSTPPTQMRLLDGTPGEI